MNNVQVYVFARTDVGMLRSGNEDSFLVADLTTGNTGLGPEMSTHHIGERGSLLVVSDGMGGAVAGEVASELAVTTIKESLLELPFDMSISEQLKTATEIANERIWNHAQQNQELSGMGATVTAVLVHQTTAYIAQVGDSRAYLIRGNRIKQLTKDQSLAQMLVDSGAIEPEQAASVPQNVIMQALGTQPSVKVVMTAVELCRNDYLLLCSDGLSNKIEDAEMRQTVQEMDDLTASCRHLVELANERGGEDNITVIIARFDGEALHSAGDSANITGSFRAINQDNSSEKPVTTTNRLGAPPPDEPPVKDRPITTLVMPTIPFTKPSEVSSADVSDAPIPPLQTTVPDAAGLTSDEAITSPLSPPPPALQVAGRRRQSYAIIWVSLLMALLLIGAAGFFYYKFYRKQTAQPSGVEQPGPAQQESQSPVEQRPETVPSQSQQ